MAGVVKNLNEDFTVLAGQKVTLYVKDGDVDLEDAGLKMSGFQAAEEAYQISPPASTTYQFKKTSGAPTVHMWIE